MDRVVLPVPVARDHEEVVFEPVLDEPPEERVALVLEAAGVRVVVALARPVRPHHRGRMNQDLDGRVARQDRRAEPVGLGAPPDRLVRPVRHRVRAPVVAALDHPHLDVPVEPVRPVRHVVRPGHDRDLLAEHVDPERRRGRGGARRVGVVEPEVVVVLHPVERGRREEPREPGQRELRVPHGPHPGPVGGDLGAGRGVVVVHVVAGRDDEVGVAGEDGAQPGVAQRAVGARRRGPRRPPEVAAPAVLPRLVDAVGDDEPDPPRPARVERAEVAHGRAGRPRHVAVGVVRARPEPRDHGPRDPVVANGPSLDPLHLVGVGRRDREVAAGRGVAGVEDGAGVRHLARHHHRPALRERGRTPNGRGGHREGDGEEAEGGRDHGRGGPTGGVEMPARLLHRAGTEAVRVSGRR